MSDHNLWIDLDTDVGECGDVVTGTVRWGPLDSAPRSIRVGLRYWTEGRGNTDSETVAEIRLDGSTTGSGRFELPVPATGPISFDGSLIRVLWEIELRIDRRMRTDPDVSHPVTILPRGGLAAWARRSAPPPTVAPPTST